MREPAPSWLASWHVDPSANRDYDFIDGLRGIAMLLVVGCHLVYVSPVSGPMVHFLAGIFGAGSCGVTVFFALSGFLISWPFWKRKVSGSVQVVPSGYGWRRFWKIVPPLVLSIVVLTPLSALMFRDSSVWWVAIQWLLGVPLVGAVGSELNPVMWSLAVEIQFYVVLPLLFLACRRMSPKTVLWTLFLVFLIVPTSFRWINAARGVYFSVFPQVDVHFPSMLDAFAFGILVAGLDNLGILRKGYARLGDVGLLMLVFSLVLMSWLNVYCGISEHARVEIAGWLTKLASALLLCYVADPANPRARALGHPWLRWCGIISYEWYLFHQPIILWSRQLFGPAAGNPFKYVAVLAGGLIAGVIAALLVYRFFSLPLLKRGRAKHTARSKAPRTQPVQHLQQAP